MTVSSDLLRLMVERDLEMVRGWRNAPEVRRVMFNSHTIDAEEHRAWFDRSSKDSDRLLLIFESEGKPSGFVQFSKASPGGVVDWGFYLSPSAPRGAGGRMGRVALSHAFRLQGFKRICGRALTGNEASRKFHLKLGFGQEGTLRAHHYDGKNYHDVVLFGLLASDWTVSSGKDHG